MRTFLKDFWKDPIPALLLLNGFGIGFPFMLAGLNMVFGPPFFENPDAIGQRVLSGLGLFGFGTTIFIFFWFLGLKAWPWMRRALHLN